MAREALSCNTSGTLYFFGLVGEFPTPLWWESQLHPAGGAASGVLIEGPEQAKGNKMVGGENTDISLHEAPP